MEYIMVTFQSGYGTPCDLKVPTFVPVDELVLMMIEALHIPSTRQVTLQAEPLGRILNNSRTLEQEGVHHGALLTLI